MESELRIEYIGPDGLAYWHGKLSTLKKTFSNPIIISKKPITLEEYG